MVKWFILFVLFVPFCGYYFGTGMVMEILVPLRGEEVMLNLPPTDFASGGNEHRHVAPHQGRCDHIRVRGQRAKANALALLRNAAQLVQRPEIDEAAARRCAELQRNVHVGATRQRSERLRGEHP